MTWLRLVIKWHAWELAAVSLSLVVIVAISLGTVVGGNGIINRSPGCFPQNLQPGCDRALTSLMSLQATSNGLFDATAVASFLIGAVLGAALPGREIETGTAQLVFSLVPSRTRWVIDRLLPIFGIAILLSAVLAVTSEALAQVLLRGSGPNGAFSWYGGRGILLPAHTLLGLSSAVLAGVVLGRVLSAVLLAGGIAAATAFAVDGVRREWLRSIAVALPDGGDLGSGMVVATGGDAVLFVPGSRYGESELRDVVLYLLAAAVCCLLAVLILRNRRPV
jgi:hypothetical protein